MKSQVGGQTQSQDSAAEHSILNKCAVLADRLEFFLVAHFGDVPESFKQSYKDSSNQTEDEVTEPASQATQGG